MDDKYRFNDFGLVQEEGHNHPPFPNIQNKTMSIPGRPGSWYFGTEKGPKPLYFPLATQGRDRGKLQRSLNDFVAFLFDEYGNPREIKIVYDYEPDKFYIARVNESFDVTRVRPFASFVLPMVAYDPYKYATANQYDPKEDYRYDQDYEYDIGLMYDNPKSFQWQYERHYSGINNYSSLVTDFMIEIQGTVTNPSVTNLNTNQKLTMPSINNGRLVIDGKRFVVIRNGQDILEGSNYNFFDIQPGEVGFLFEGENPNATVTYKWLHKFN